MTTSSASFIRYQQLCNMRGDKCKVQSISSRLGWRMCDTEYGGWTWTSQQQWLCTLYTTLTQGSKLYLLFSNHYFEKPLFKQNESGSLN